MASTFAGMAVASNGLSNSQYSMYVTSTNISNANTEGYSVQTVHQTSGTSGIQYSTTSGGMMASVEAEQAQSFYLNTQYWDAQSDYSYWSTYDASMSGVEGTFHSLDDTGFSSLYDEFVVTLENLSTTPDDSAARLLAAESGLSFCDSLNETAQSLTDAQSMINEQISTTVDQVNSLAEQIAQLNDDIKMTSLGGGNANALQDQQDLLIDELASLVDIDVNKLAISSGGSKYETIQISIGGSSLVTDSVVSALAIETEGTLLNGEPKYEVTWASNGQVLKSSGGELGALLDVRDGSGGAGVKGIPYYMEELDEWAQTFAVSFNEGLELDDGSTINGHADGYDLEGNTGCAFFTNSGLDSEAFYLQAAEVDGVYENITALNISVNADLLENPDMMAVSSRLGEEGNAENLSDILAMTDSEEVFGTSTPHEEMLAVVSTLSSNVSYAATQNEASEESLQLYTTWRMSETSVSIDEEAAKLESYQNSYNASAKVIEVWNEVISVTLGLIGG